MMGALYPQITDQIEKVWLFSLKRGEKDGESRSCRPIRGAGGQLT